MRGQLVVPAEPQDGPAAAFSTSWRLHRSGQLQESSDSECASSSEEEEDEEEEVGPGNGWAGGARPSQMRDESFGSALKRLKDDAVMDASPNTKSKANVEFRRLAKSNTRAGKFIRRRAAPSKEQLQREKDEAELWRHQRDAPATQGMRRLQSTQQMFPVISARTEQPVGPASAQAQPQPALTARPPTQRKAKNPKTPRARSASAPTSAIRSLPVPHLNTPRTGRGVSARKKQAAMRARSAHIVRCPARSTHIAALPMKDYQPPASLRTTLDSEQGGGSLVGGKRMPEGLLSRMAQRRPHMEGSPLVIISVEGAMLDVCCGSQGYFSDGGELQKPSLHVRPGLVEGLRCISASFQVALVTQLGRKPLLQLLKHLDANSVALDAIYVLPGTGGSGGGKGIDNGESSGWGHRATTAAASTTQDYSVVYSDFGISPQHVCNRVLVVSAINLDLDEVRDRDGSRLLFTPSVSAPNFAVRLPTPVDLSDKFDQVSTDNTNDVTTSPRRTDSGVATANQVDSSRCSGGSVVPVVLLVPNPMSQAEFRALPMTAVASAVHALASSTWVPPSAEKYVAANAAGGNASDSSSGRVPPSWTRGFDQIDPRRLVGRAAALDCPLKKITAVRNARAQRGKVNQLSVASAVVGCPWRLHMTQDDAVWEDVDTRETSYSPMYRVAVMRPPERGAPKLPVYETLEKPGKLKTEKKPKPPACANVDRQRSAAGPNREALDPVESCDHLYVLEQSSTSGVRPPVSSLGVGICEADKQKQLDVAKAAHDLRKKLAATKTVGTERAGGNTTRVCQGVALAKQAPPPCAGTHNAALSAKQAMEKASAAQFGLVGSNSGSGSSDVVELVVGKKKGQGSKQQQTTPRTGRVLGSINVNRVNAKPHRELERGAVGHRPFTGNNHPR